MARTLKNTADYFPHDAHASTESATLTVLEGQFGNDGYAFWFKLLEKLASSDGHFLDWHDSRRLQVFCGKAHITEDKGVEMVNLLVEMGAVDKELWDMKKILWCQNLVDNLADVYRNRRREMPVKPVSTSDKSITTSRNPITTPEKAISTGERKLKETRLNEIKGDKSNTVTRNYLNKGTVKTLQDALEAYADNIAKLPVEELSEEMENEVELAVKSFGANWVVDAIREAVVLGNPRWRYVGGILKNWERDANLIPGDRQ